MLEDKSKGSFTRRLFSHTINFGLGSVLPKIIGFLLIPLYTVYLSPEDFGIVDLATSFGAFILIFMRLGMPGSVTRFYYDFNNGEKLKDYVTTIFWFLIACSIFIGGLSWWLGSQYMDKLIPGLPFYPFAVIMILVAFFNSNTDLQRRLIQVREQSAYSAKLSTAIAFITIIFSLVFVVGYDMGALGIVLALLITAIVFFFQAQLYLANDLKGAFQIQYIKPSLLYALGVLPSHIMANFVPLLNKVLLAGAISVSAVGVLGIALRFTNPLNIFIGAFQNAYLPIYYSYRKNNNPQDIEKLEKANSHIWFVACILFLGTIFFLPGVITLLTPEKFHGAKTLIGVLAVGFLFRMYGNFFIVEVYYSKATYQIPLVTALSIGANMAIVIFSVKYLGALSVALGITVGFVISTLLYMMLASKKTTLPRDKFFFTFTFIFCGIAFITQLFFLKNILLHPIIEVLLYCSVIIMFSVLSIRMIGMSFREILSFWKK